MASAASNILNLLTGGSGKVKEREDFEGATVDPATGEIVGGRDRFTQSKIGSFLARLSGDDTARSKNIEQNDLLQQMQLQSMLQRSNNTQSNKAADDRQARQLQSDADQRVIDNQNRIDAATELDLDKVNAASTATQVAKDVAAELVRTGEISKRNAFTMRLAELNNVPVELLDQIAPDQLAASIARLGKETSESNLASQTAIGATGNAAQASFEAQNAARANDRLLTAMAEQGMGEVRRVIPTKVGDSTAGAAAMFNRLGSQVLNVNTQSDEALTDARIQSLLSRGTDGAGGIAGVNLLSDKRNREKFAELNEGGTLRTDDGKMFGLFGGILYEKTLNGWESIEEGE